MGSIAITQWVTGLKGLAGARGGGRATLEMCLNFLASVCALEFFLPELVLGQRMCNWVQKEREYIFCYSGSLEDTGIGLRQVKIISRKILNSIE